jgi:endoplasmic reticulum chaperone BiP
VAAQDKLSGKSQSITITSDRGRLTQDDIDRMVKEAEENAEADRIAKEKVEAKNQLEAYLYNLRNMIQDTLKDKLSEADKQTIQTKVNDALTWLEQHTSEEKEIYEEKRKEVEDVANPIISKAYQQSSASSSSSSEDSSSSSSSHSDNNNNHGDSDGGPTVEEAE